MSHWLTPHKKLLKPIDSEHPCGENLEYDPAFILLFAKVEPKTEAQYGDFTSEPQSINWGEVSSDVEALLLRSKDIRLLVLWLRAQVNINGAQGLASGLSLIATNLAKYPQDLYPRIELDGEKDEFYRANALSALIDVDGLLNETRQIYLSRNNAYRLQVRDIERSLAAPRPTDAIPISNIVQQLNALLDQESKELKALEDASKLSQEIQALVNQQMSEFAPNFEVLIKLLSWFDINTPVTLQKHGLFRPNTIAHTEEDTQTTSEPVAILPQIPLISSHDAHHGRLEAQILIRQARQWFATNEPSSPVTLLLQQAEGLIGKPFEQVFQAIPADLVAQWRTAQEESETYSD